jgi:hypothetical protein
VCSCDWASPQFEGPEVLWYFLRWCCEFGMLGQGVESDSYHHHRALFWMCRDVNLGLIFVTGYLLYDTDFADGLSESRYQV